MSGLMPKIQASLTVWESKGPKIHGLLLTSAECLLIISLWADEADVLPFPVTVYLHHYQLVFTLHP